MDHGGVRRQEREGGMITRADTIPCMLPHSRVVRSGLLIVGLLFSFSS